MLADPIPLTEGGTAAAAASTVRMRMRQAIAAALADEMRADPTVLLLGEDIGGGGGVFKATEGLLEEFGPQRVRDTPISEMGFLGAAVGAAATGLRPVVEMMFMEFIGVGLDQLVTQAAKYRYLSGGRLSVPLVVRGSVGAGLGFGAQHSQTLEHLFTATPGLSLAVASTPANAYGLVGGDANAVAPKKRPLSSMTPTMRLSPAAIWRAISAHTGIWFSGFFELFACEASIIRRCANPLAAMSLQAASTLPAS